VGLKRILRPKRKEVTGECTGLPKEELSYLFTSPTFTNDYSDDQIKDSSVG
jgi:hypothetical protein